MLLNIKRELVLASRSFRRQELLKEIGLKFKIHPSRFDELINKRMDPIKFVRQNAIGKARNVAPHHPKAIIIGADTIGSYKGHILGKPNSPDDARRMLRTLSGTRHRVLTGLCLIDNLQQKEITFVEKTWVTFDKMTEEQITNYLETGEFFDKAAAFAIQGLGGLFIKKIEGSYFNVVGLPLFRLRKMFEKLGVQLI